MRPARIGYSTDGFCRCISQRQPLLDISRPPEGGASRIHLSLLAHDLLQQHYASRIRRKEERTVRHGQRRQAKLSGERLPLCSGLRPYFRWLQHTIIPKNLAAPDFLQPSPCAYAVDFAVAASSFRSLMTALSPPFVVVDRVTGLNLNHRKCCWVQYGNDSCHELLNWAATNCEEFREVEIVKCARYVGTLSGPEGYLHCWIAPRRKNFPENQENESTKSRVERLVDFKIYALSVLGYLGSISAPGGATLKEAHALQSITAGPKNAILTNLSRAGSTCGLGPDKFGIHILSLAARYRTTANSGTLVNSLANIRAAREHDGAPIFALSQNGKKSS